MTGEHEVTCPMGGCAEALHLGFVGTYALHPDDLYSTGVSPEDAHAMTWQVECLAGHVLLLPAYGCGCDDPEGSACQALGHDPGDYNWSPEESAKFLAPDVERLQALIRHLEVQP